MKVYNSGTVSGGVRSKDAGTDSVSKDGFLKILAAQLQHQDPMNAKDNTEYVSQMAQFTALEQMQNLNTSMKELLLSQKFQEANAMIGKTAKVLTGDNEFVTGVVTYARLGSGEINIVIDNKEYSADNVVELSGKGSDEDVISDN